MVAERSESSAFACVHHKDDLTFLHEIGHLFGCDHNIEDGKEQGYGYQMRRLNLRTIMARRMDHFTERIPFFSSPLQTYNGVALGDSRIDNRRQIMRVRFLISKFGDESGNCDHHSTACAIKCVQNCCPMYKSEGEYEESLGEECEDCKGKIYHQWKITM